jgi:hypothetical protein
VCGVSQPAVDEQASAIGLEPFAQPRPMADQRFVRDDDRALIDRN